jgi:hypothetical protein
MGTVALDHSSGAAGPLRCGGVDAEKVIHGSFTFSSSYTTGGESLDIGKYFTGDIAGIRRVVFGSFPVTATVASVQYVQSTGKVKAFVAAGTEVAAETNLSTVTVEFVAFGLGF